MPTDFSALLRRDHGDLVAELARLLDPMTTRAELRLALDGVRLGLTAHAEAEDIVLGPFETVAGLRRLIEQSRNAHRAQEDTLSALLCSPVGSDVWREHARRLGDLVHAHATYEASQLLPALRAYPAEFERLAGAFATERLRQLAMLQPSAPVLASYVYADAS